MFNQIVRLKLGVLFFICLFPLNIFSQLFLEKRVLSNSEFTNSSQNPPEKSNATLSGQNENSFKFRYSFSFGKLLVIPSLNYLERHSTAENFSTIRLKSGNTLSSGNFPESLLNKAARLGLGHILENSDFIYFGYKYGESGGAKNRPQNVKNAQYTDLTGLYDISYRESIYRLGLFYVTKKGYETVYPVIGYYNNNNQPFRIRLLLGGYLRTYYDVNEHWGINFKINNENTDYRLDNRSFNGQLLTYNATDYNFGVQYRAFKNILFNFDFGIRTQRSYVFQPADSKDKDNTGIDTLNLKDTLYVSLYFTLGPRNAPE